MKKILLTTLVVTLLAGSIWAQEAMYIHKTNGTIQAVMLNEVDSIVFYSAATTVLDIDGNVYHTLVIGTQTWLVENLMTTRLNDGTDIPLTTDNTAWESLTSMGYCWYDNDESTNKPLYGALYNWYATTSGKLCPAGFHVPTDAEWTTLEEYLIANGYNYDGSNTGNLIAKSLATDNGWRTNSNPGAVGNDDYPDKRNASGFSAVPSGSRQAWGAFFAKGEGTAWWSTTENSAADAWSRGLSYNGNLFGRTHDIKTMGHSVRCMKD